MSASPARVLPVSLRERTSGLRRSRTRVPVARPARSTSRSCWPPVITALLPPSRPAPARPGEPVARITRHPGSAFCNWTPPTWHRYPRTVLAGVTPPAHCQRYPAVGRYGRTQPPCGRDVPGAGKSPAGAGHPAATAAVLAPACRARQHPAHAAAAVPLEPLSLAPEARTGGIAQWINRFERRGSRQRHPKAHCRDPAHPWHATGRCGRQRHRLIQHASAVYQQALLSVTASA
jgi:hypothetical protein